MACFLSGRTDEIIVRAPFPMPEDPAPAMALPMINIGEETAAPQITDPTSKRKKNRWQGSVNDRYLHF